MKLDPERAEDLDDGGKARVSVFRKKIVEALTAEGVQFVFNTPNEQSRPGYLKMGWRVVGRPAVAVRPRSLRSAIRMARGHVPAQRWSEPSDVGADAGRFLRGEARVIGSAELRQLVPFSDSYFWRLEKAGQFPRRIKIGQHRVGWALNEIVAWIEARKAQRGRS